MSLLDKISTWVKATANATVRGTGRSTRTSGTDAERTRTEAKRQLAHVRDEISKAKARQQRAEQAWRKADAAGEVGAAELKKLYEQQVAFAERMQQEHDTLQKVLGDVDVVIAAEREVAKTVTKAAETGTGHSPAEASTAPVDAKSAVDLEARKARLAGGDKR